MGWTVRGSNPGVGEIFRTRPNRPWAPPSILYNGYRVFPGGKRPGRGVDHPPLYSAEVNERARAIPPLRLWAFVACSRVNFTFPVKPHTPTETPFGTLCLVDERAESVDM